MEVFAVSAGCTAFVRLIKDGNALGLAAAHALEADPDFDLSQALALLIAHGAITGLHPCCEVSP